MYPTLPKDLNRISHISQNQSTVEINRQIIHPRRNRNFQTPRVHFDIPQSPIPTTSENSCSTLPETPPLLSQRSTSSIPSDYLGSTPTSEQLRENPFNPPPPIPPLLTEQISNTIPDPNQTFYAMCDASNFGIGAALLQSHSGTNKMNLISAKSRLFTQAELRLSILMRECTAIFYTLTEFEFLIL